ncbi:hypothetical protein TNCV_4136641 [Trichonephila clavipes]|nr:hypothetical protein TNCV_4136641 [Trichonephila clavipes]
MNETTQQEKTTQLSSMNEQLNSATGTKQLNSAAGTKQLNSSVGTKQLNSALPSTAYNRLQRLQPPATAYNRLQPPATACTACTAFTAESAFSTYLYPLIFNVMIQKKYCMKKSLVNYNVVDKGLSFEKVWRFNFLAKKKKFI